VKSLLVRARIALAESSQARQLTCDEVRVELAEAAEGLAKVDGPARRHIKGCDACRAFRTQLRSDSKALAAIFPAGPLLILKGALLGKLSGLFGGGGGGAAAGAGGGGAAGAAGAGAAGAGAAGAGAAGAGAAAAGGTAVTSAAVGGAAAAGGAAAGGAAGAAATGAAAAIGTKAAAGIATAAIIAGGAAEIKHVTQNPSPKPEPKAAKVAQADKPPAVTPLTAPPPATPTAEPAAATTPPATPAPTQPTETVTVPPQPAEPGATGGTATSTLPQAIGNKRKRHKGHNIANTDSNRTGTTPQTGPVTTGVEPATTCDANGDGVTDPGAPSNCATGTTTTGTEQGAIDPATVYSAPRKKRAAPREKSSRKSKSTARSAPKKKR
jgi:hypothetical protein